MRTQRGTGLCRSRVHSWHKQLAWPATAIHTWSSGKTLWEKTRPLLQAGSLSVFSSDADRHSVFFRGGSGDLIDSLSRSTDTESPVLEPRAGEEKELWEMWACERLRPEELTWHQEQTRRAAFCFVRLAVLSTGVSARNLDSLAFVRACVCVFSVVAGRVCSR